uniref:Uncharacterized protein LOC100182049 n=1 Tax=Phallusia mammillata TaxID=59560 RepID=A0A6F9DGW9_9ASCI|nr:uncharacterized protein LOC100182049 [Phallusia mammillata]
MNYGGVNIDANAYETIQMNEGQNHHVPEFWETSSNVYEKPISKFHRENGDTSSTPGAFVQEYENVKIQSKRSEKKCVQKPSFSKLSIMLVCVIVILAALAIVFGMFYFMKDQNEREKVNETPRTTGRTSLNTTEYVTTKPTFASQTTGQTALNRTKYVTTKKPFAPLTTGQIKFNTTESLPAAKSPLGTFPNPARSCVELRDSGFKDGIYVIKTSLKSFEVYCDMIAAGGGWILAATINDRNFNMTEAYGGSWFVAMSNNYQNYMNYQNWMNRNYFGTFATCTRSDFKSQAYFEYKASDIMLRHVPNKAPLEVSREQSFLQYQTENEFLQMYGGNLLGIFNDHYPIKPRNGSSLDVISIMDRLEAKSTEITRLINDFHFYDYGSLSHLLNDSEIFGTRDGMRIFFSTIGNCSGDTCGSKFIYYGSDVGCENGNVMRSSRKMHPFIALFDVRNKKHCLNQFRFILYSRRTDADSKVEYRGNHTINNFFLYYDAHCRYGTSYASLCDVWFYVLNTEDWKSSKNPNITLTSYSNSTSYNFEWTINEPVFNTLFGYTMVSRKNGSFHRKKRDQRSLLKNAENYFSI